MIVFVVCVIGVIVLFILDDLCSDQINLKAMDFSSWFEFSLLSATTVVTCWVYYQITLLDVNPHPISFLDDLLLFICLPSFFLYFFVNIFAASSAEENVAGMILSNSLMVKI
jgi:hypothetical protein